MRYQKVTALIAGFVFVASSMAACGVYGSMEYSVYGAAESTEVADYGAVEYYDIYDEAGHMTADVLEKDAYDEATNVAATVGFEQFHLPSYLQQEEGDPADDTNQVSYVAEQQDDSHYAKITFVTGSVESLNLTQDEKDMLSSDDGDSSVMWIDYGNIMSERLLDELWAQFGYDRDTDMDQAYIDADEKGDILPDYNGQMEEMIVNGQDIFVWAISYNMNGETKYIYYTVLLNQEGDSYMTACLEMTDGLEYCYAGDFFHILENAEYAE